MSNFTLFFANAAVALIICLVFLVTGSAKKERFWVTWSLANALIAAALVAFMFEAELGDLFIVAVPNGLLVLAMSLKWYGSRQFEEQRLHHAMVWGPTALFIGICMIPPVFENYGAVYTLVNILLAALAGATALEFWRLRDRLRSPSRYALVLVYGILAASFAVRVAQGILAGDTMSRSIPDDLLLMTHLSIALIHLTGSGAFALSLAYEQDAARLTWTANHDPLTGLLNRAAFEEEVRAQMGAGDAVELNVLMIDVDHFKQVNDRHGHAAGDEALKTCAVILKETLPEGCPIARWGGDEFAAMVRCSREQATAIAAEIGQKARQATLLSQGTRTGLSFSIGVYHASRRPDDFSLLMRQADAALYAAKTRGRDRSVLVAA